MKAAVRYGLIGAGVALAILFTQYYLVDETVALHPAFMYLVQLCLFVSIIASIKVTKDKESGGNVDLKTGLRAGVTTVLIITLLIGAFFFGLYKTMSSEKMLALADKQFTEFFKENPVLDTGEVKFQKAIFSADSALGKGNYGAAKLHLEVARQIRPGDTRAEEKLKAVNPQLITQYSSNSFVFGLVFQRMIGQLLMGAVIAFFTTMVFRFKQQSDNA
ncbi:MAG: DUF4199 family protein [Bacteroidota bacterium]